METVNLPSVVGLGLKSTSQLNTTYTVGVGQSIFQNKKLHHHDDDQSSSSHQEYQEYKDDDLDYDVELSAEHVPLGEILERLQSDDGDKGNLIRLHAVNDSSAGTISATVNVAAWSPGNNYQNEIGGINDVLFNGRKDEGAPQISVTSTATIYPHSLSPHTVPDSSSLFNNSPSPGSGEESPRPGLLNVFALSPPPSNHGYETKTSPQECNLCNKMFGNASALAKHRLTHSDERKYLCNVCHKAFKRQDHLNGHLLTHRNKKPFECTSEGCNKSYCDARSLRRHRENHHSHSKDEKCLVSPASSVASSDLDEKSLGSESCDGSLKGTKLVFTGFNSPEKEKLLVDNDTRQFQLIEQIIRETKESEASNATIQSVVLPSTPTHTHNTFQHQPISRSTSKSSQEGEPNRNMVECTICSRKFKNIPALNGHMRLHGGYYRKDNDKSKHPEHKTTIVTEAVSTHTVSSNVRALIEEKIIQKRKLEPTLVQRTLSQPNPCHPLSPRYISLPTCSTPTTPCSTSAPVSHLPEPPNKRFALEGRNNKSISSLDNLVFPVLPVPDTSKLLANLRAKHQSHLAPCILPAPPLPNIPLPSNPVNNIKTETQVKSAHLNNLLKINQRTDFSVGIGSSFQANLPAFRVMAEDSKYGAIPMETLMWSHRVEMFPESQLDSYLKLASSSAVKNFGNSAEHALYILLQCNGNIIKATQALLTATKTEERSGRPSWTAEEVDMFYEALCKHKKDFTKIAGDLANKTTKDCVEFYYLWKNICREESQSFKSIINSSTEGIDSALLPL